MSKKVKKSLRRTEEEHLVQLQHRAQAEEEMSKKKEGMLTLFLEDKLQKEQKKTAVNMLKVNAGWSFILRQARTSEQQENIRVAKETFEREVDELDLVIQKLIGDLHESERQTAHMQASHLQQLDHLLAQDRKRTQCLQQYWGGGLQGMSSLCSSEKQHMFALFEEQQDKLQSQVSSADTMQELKKKSMEREASFSSPSDPKMVQLELKDNLPEHISNILGSWKQNIDSLKKKEDEMALLLDDVTQRLQSTLKLKNKAEQLRNKVRVSEQEKETMEENLTTCKNEMKQRLIQAQAQSRGQGASGRPVAKKQLTQLAVQGDVTTKKLQATITQGERVLRAAKLCHKWERRIEALQPHFAPLHLPPEEATQGSEDVQGLQSLQQRISRAVLLLQTLRKHKKDETTKGAAPAPNGLHDDCSLLHISKAPIISAAAAGQQRRTVLEPAHIAERHMWKT